MYVYLYLYLYLSIYIHICCKHSCIHTAWVYLPLFRPPAQVSAEQMLGELGLELELHDARQAAADQRAGEASKEGLRQGSKNMGCVYMYVCLCIYIYVYTFFHMNSFFGIYT